MTTSSAPGGAPKAGRDRRRFPRYDVAVAVIVRKKTGDVQLMTADVSRHGAFIKSDTPVPVRQLVQVRFRLPDGECDAMCMVARWLGPDSPRGSGMGVDFFALSKDAKNLWERFIQQLRARDAGAPFQPMSTGSFSSPSIAGAVALPSTHGVPLPPPPAEPEVVGANGLPSWMSPSTVTGELHTRRNNASYPPSPPPLPGQTLVSGPAPSSALAPPTWPPQASTPLAEIAQGSPFGVAGVVPLPGTKRPPPPPVEDDLPVISGKDEGDIVMMRFPDRDQLRGFVANEVERGGMFLKTPLVKEVGEKVDVLLVHPETEEEFRLDGTVVRRLITGPVDARGLGIFFRALTPEQNAQLAEFVESGIEVVELGAPVTQRQIELEAAVAREPDSAEALEQLGTYLLDEEGDLGGALTALTRALVLGPSQVSIHASLARAYRRIGDPVKVRSHERCAEALMLFQERMRIRMGVGDE
jgi:hypothetical protein